MPLPMSPTDSMYPHGEPRCLGKGTRSPVMPESRMDSRTNDSELSESRFRSHTAIALGSGVPAGAPVLALTGSLALGALVAVLAVVCVGVAALVI